MVVGLHDPIKSWGILWKKTDGIDPEGLERRHIGSRLQKWQWIGRRFQCPCPFQTPNSTVRLPYARHCSLWWEQGGYKIKKHFYPFSHRTYRLVGGKHTKRNHFNIIQQVLGQRYFQGSMKAQLRAFSLPS